VNTVFFDRTCGKKLPQALKLLGLPVEGHADHFADDVQDDVWLAVVGERGWFVVTNDKNIRRNEAELHALVTCVFRRKRAAISAESDRAFRRKRLSGFGTSGRVESAALRG
jgi:PIN domain-containing protein